MLLSLSMVMVLERKAIKPMTTCVCNLKIALPSHNSDVSKQLDTTHLGTQECVKFVIIMKIALPSFKHCIPNTVLCRSLTIDVVMITEKMVCQLEM